MNILGHGGIFPRILNLGTMCRREVVVSYTANVTHWARCSVGPRTGLKDAYGREICCPFGKSNRDCLVAKTLVYSLYMMIQEEI